MGSFFKFATPAVAALGLVLSFSTASAVAQEKEKVADKAAVGTVTGTVVDKDGKAVEGAPIRVMKPTQGGGRRGGPGGGAGNADAPKPEAKAADEKPAAPGAGGGAGGAGGEGRRPRPTPVAEGASDKDGKFSIANVPAGDYMVVAAVQGKGMARGNVTVKAGESATVELKLQERQPGQGGERRPRAGAGQAN